MFPNVHQIVLLSCLTFLLMNCNALLVPTHSSIISCFLPNHTKICENHEIYFEGFIEDSANSDTLVYKLSSELYDQFGRPWKGNEEISLTFFVYNSGVFYPLKSLGRLDLSHESSSHWNGISPCGSTELCCFGERRYFQKNPHLSYNRYEIGVGTVELSLGIMIQQGSYNTFVTLSRNERTRTFPGGEVSILVELHSLQVSNVFHGWYNLLSHISNSHMEDAFVVPSSYFCRFSTETNCLGMSEDAYLSWLSPTIREMCPRKNIIFQLDRNPTPWVSQIEGMQTKITDILLQSVQKTCFVSNLHSRFGDNSRMFLQCNDLGVIVISIKLLVSKGSLRISPNFGNPIVLDKGLRQYSSTDEHALIFISITNHARVPAKIVVVPKTICIFKDGIEQCSQSAISNISQRETIGPDRTLSIEFVVARSFIEGRNGRAEFELLQTFGNNDIPIQSITVYFDALASSNVEEVPGELNCPVEYMIVNNSIPYCKRRCTTQDVRYSPELNLCVPIDCSQKYGGLRNYFNTKLQLCEPTAICHVTEEYIPVDNVCVAKVDEDPNTQPNTNHTDSDTSEEFDDGDGRVHGFDFPINCNGNGFVVNNTCSCYDGYKHPNNVNIFSMCTVVVGNSSSTSSISNFLTFDSNLEIVFVVVSIIVCMTVISVCCVCGCISMLAIFDIYIRSRKFSKLEQESDSDDCTTKSDFTIEEFEEYEDFNSMDEAPIGFENNRQYSSHIIRTVRNSENKVQRFQGPEEHTHLSAPTSFTSVEFSPMEEYLQFSIQNANHYPELIAEHLHKQSHQFSRDKSHNSRAIIANQLWDNEIEQW